MPVPDNPVNLKAVSGDKEVTLEWDSPGSNDIPPTFNIVTNYEYSSDSGVSWNSTVTAVQNITIGGLSNGTEYTYQVRAVNDDGSSLPPHPEISVFSGAPSQITDLKVYSRNISQNPLPTPPSVWLEWSTPTSPVQNVSITSYEYTTSTNPNNPNPVWKIINVSSVTTFGIPPGSKSKININAQSDNSNFVSGTKYYFKIRSYIDYGSKAYSASSNETEHEVDSPNGVRNLTAVPGSKHVTLNWDAPEPGVPISANTYSYQVEINGNKSYTQSRHFTSEILAEGVPHTFDVKVVDEGPPLVEYDNTESITITLDNDPFIVEYKPSGLRKISRSALVTKGSTEVIVNLAGGVVNITRFDIIRTNINGGDKIEIVYEKNYNNIFSITLMDDNAKIGEKYIYKVSAYSDGALVPFFTSLPETITIPDPRLCCPSRFKYGRWNNTSTNLKLFPSFTDSPMSNNNIFSNTSYQMKKNELFKYLSTNRAYLRR